MPRRYKQVRAGELLFHFAYDSDDPTSTTLHIDARHSTTVDDALRTWFDRDAEEYWNEERKRVETRSESHVLYWTWLTENKRVLVITCFTRED